MRQIVIAVAAAAALVAGSSGAGAAPTYHVERRIPLPDGGWDLATFDTGSHRVYLARTDAIDAIDVQSGKVTVLAPAGRSHTVVAVNGGAEVLETDGATDAARFIDARSGAELATVKVGQGPDAALLDPATGLALVMNARSGEVTLIDPRAHAVVGTIPVGGSLEIAVADGAGRVFVNVEDRNEVVALDLKARTARHIALTGCDGPTGIAYLPRSHRVLSACGNGVVALTNADTLAVERTLPLGQGPDTAMYDSPRGVALVPCGRSGDLWLFEDGAGGVSPAGHVATQRGARTGALDPGTGRAYLPAADYLPPATPNGRPQIKPGSVTLVVVGP